ncbi:MAG: hypothetical protein Q9191_002866 [Dirinaria sp. TL-2023a]
MLALQLQSAATLTIDSSVETPQLSPTQYLIRVHACAITANELTWPETVARSLPIPGHDVCGTVISPPSDGSLKFNLGDEVYGLTSFSRDGGAAQYAVAEPEELAPKPRNLTSIECATIPLSLLTAWQALIVHAKIKDGGSVLILGGSGGVGVMAVQLARAKGMQVTTTCGERSIAFVKELGAHSVIDYVIDGGDVKGEFDVVLDCVGVRARSKAWRNVKSGGTLVSVAMPIEEGEGGEANGLFFIVEPNGGQLEGLRDLIEGGKLRPVVDSVYPLQDGEKAFEELAKGHARGKIVLEI